MGEWNELQTKTSLVASSPERNPLSFEGNENASHTRARFFPTKKQQQYVRKRLRGAGCADGLPGAAREVHRGDPGARGSARGVGWGGVGWGGVGWGGVGGWVSWLGGVGRW